jgi:hypothetical protein
MLEKSAKAVERSIIPDVPLTPTTRALQQAYKVTGEIRAASGGYEKTE